MANHTRAYQVQIGLYSILDNARRVASQYGQYQPEIDSLSGSGGRSLHAVRYGAFASLSEAGKAAAEFRQSQGAAAIVIGP